MNRAWIPAGALAGVSVAGLIALGPLTDSLGTSVSFKPSVAVTTPAAGKTHVLPVSVDVGPKGKTKTKSESASLKVIPGRGGPAASTQTTNSDAGEVGFRRTPSTPSTTSSAAVESKPPVTQKTVKRQSSIGADSGPNGDTGLAGSGSGSQSLGAQSGTPGSDAP